MNADRYEFRGRSDHHETGAGPHPDRDPGGDADGPMTSSYRDAYYEHPRLAFRRYSEHAPTSPTEQTLSGLGWNATWRSAHSGRPISYVQKTTTDSRVVTSAEEALRILLGGQSSEHCEATTSGTPSQCSRVKGQHSRVRGERNQVRGQEPGSFSLRSSYAAVEMDTDRARRAPIRQSLDDALKRIADSRQRLAKLINAKPEKNGQPTAGAPPVGEGRKSADKGKAPPVVIDGQVSTQTKAAEPARTNTKSTASNEPDKQMEPTEKESVHLQNDEGSTRSATDGGSSSLDDLSREKHAIVEAKEMTERAVQKPSPKHENIPTKKGLLQTKTAPWRSSGRTGENEANETTATRWTSRCRHLLSSRHKQDHGEEGDKPVSRETRKNEAVHDARTSSCRLMETEVETRHDEADDALLSSELTTTSSSVTSASVGSEENRTPSCRLPESGHRNEASLTEELRNGAFSVEETMPELPPTAPPSGDFGPPLTPLSPSVLPDASQPTDTQQQHERREGAKRQQGAQLGSTQQEDSPDDAQQRVSQPEDDKQPEVTKDETTQHKDTQKGVQQQVANQDNKQREVEHHEEMQHEDKQNGTHCVNTQKEMIQNGTEIPRSLPQVQSTAILKDTASSKGQEGRNPADIRTTAEVSTLTLNLTSSAERKVSDPDAVRRAVEESGVTASDVKQARSAVAAAVDADVVAVVKAASPETMPVDLDAELVTSRPASGRSRRQPAPLIDSSKRQLEAAMTDEEGTFTPPGGATDGDRRPEATDDAEERAADANRPTVNEYRRMTSELIRTRLHQERESAQHALNSPTSRAFDPERSPIDTSPHIEPFAFVRSSQHTISPEDTVRRIEMLKRRRRCLSTGNLLNDGDDVNVEPNPDVSESNGNTDDELTQELQRIKDLQRKKEAEIEARLALNARLELNITKNDARKEEARREDNKEITDDYLRSQQVERTAEKLDWYRHKRQTADNMCNARLNRLLAGVDQRYVEHQSEVISKYISPSSRAAELILSGSRPSRLTSRDTMHNGRRSSSSDRIHLFGNDEDGPKFRFYTSSPFDV